MKTLLLKFVDQDRREKKDFDQTSIYIYIRYNDKLFFLTLLLYARGMYLLMLFKELIYIITVIII